MEISFSSVGRAMAYIARDIVFFGGKICSTVIHSTLRVTGDQSHIMNVNNELSKTIKLF
jgi:hypothetical protein